MRPVGVVRSARGLVPSAHLCWAYSRRSDYRERAAEFLRDGLAEGQYVELVGPGDVTQLADEVRGLPGVEAALASGQLRVCPVEEFYVMAAPGVVDPVASVPRRVRAVQRATAAGHSAFRAVVDATPLAGTPRGGAALARLEHLLDAQMTRLPLATLCAYDLHRVDEATVTHLAALHPLAGPGTGAVRVHAEPGVDLALSGEADGAAAQALTAALGSVLPLVEHDDLRLGARQLTFIDHGTLLLLDRLLVGHGRTAVLQSASPTVVNLSRLLPLTALRVQEVDAP